MKLHIKKIHLESFRGPVALACYFFFVCCLQKRIMWFPGTKPDDAKPTAVPIHVSLV